MSDAAKSVRHKREVILIDDDESANDQPVAKIVKREEEPVLSSEVLLQQKVLKLENDLQRAVRKAGEYLHRAETAETHLDSKRGLIDGKEKQTIQELRNDELARENEALKTEMAKMRRGLDERINSLSKRLREEQLKTAEVLTRIDQLKLRLALYEKGPVPTVDQAANLFQLCVLGSRESISFPSAHAKLYSAVAEYKGATPTERFNEAAQSLFKRLPQLHSMTLFCHACYMTLNQAEILRHFLSNGHQQKTIDRGAGVSTAAVDYWENKLKGEVLAAAAAAAREISAARAKAAEAASAAVAANAATKAAKAARKAAAKRLKASAYPPAHPVPAAAPPKQQQADAEAARHLQRVRLEQYAVKAAAAAQAAARLAARSMQQPTTRVDEKPKEIKNEIKMEEEDRAATALYTASSNEVVKFCGKLYTLPSSALSVKVLDLVQHAVNYNQLKKGANEVQKTLDLGIAEIVVLAGDAKSEELSRLSPLHTLCKMKNIPYVFVKSKNALGRACRITSPVTVCAITRSEGSQLGPLIHQIKIEV